jgi:hypothetical protein
MGEWSEYFEDFPEENPAKYATGKLDPRLADAQREAQQKAARKASNEQQQLDTEIAAIVRKHRTPG